MPSQLRPKRRPHEQRNALVRPTYRDHRDQEKPTRLVSNERAESERSVEESKAERGLIKRERERREEVTRTASEREGQQERGEEGRKGGGSSALPGFLYPTKQDRTNCHL